MAFKRKTPSETVPDSPEQILLDSPRRTIQGVLLHQGEIMRSYVANAVSQSDVALQLPTGSGKTLVGLMVSEWRRRKFKERIVYLCPTRQLVNQVVEQADKQYGLAINGFTGPHTSYAPTAKAEYQNGDRIAVTTYSSLFNTNPFFTNPAVVVIDDAHAAESYITELWTVHVERTNKKHATLHTALCSILKPLLDPTGFTRLTGEWDSPRDLLWVDKISTPDFAEIRDQFVDVMDTHVRSLDLRFPWSMIRDHLHACHLYVGSQEILVRPLIAPTWMHRPFADATQRIYMSATLGAGGDLERLTGQRKIMRIAIPQGWEKQGIGRRYFIFPDMSLNDEEAVRLRVSLMQYAGRSLVIVPNDKARESMVTEVTDNLGFPTFKAEDIEESKIPFVSSQNAVAIVANRYDGIDFPNEDCRLLFIEGLPKTTNLQELFFMSRMGSAVLLNERILTRILQAVGRCTRSLADYSAVIVSGEEITGYLADRRQRIFLHPELQAELEFGIEQSQGATVENLLENFGIFIKHKEEWEEVNKDILEKRNTAKQLPFPAMNDLCSIVGHEIGYQMSLWQGDFEAALENCENVLAGLTAPELGGYRALWHYLAGSTAWLGWKNGISGLDRKARKHFTQAKEASRGIPWLVTLARFQTKTISEPKDNPVLLRQIEQAERVLAHFGTVHNRAFSQAEKEILEGLAGSESGPFEQAQIKLGRMLGFDADKSNGDATPDPWWIAGGDICFIFEDHSGAKVTSALDATKARQVSSHPNWVRNNLPVVPTTEVLAVLITPVTTAKAGAIPHLGDVALWPIEEYRDWARNALATIRKIRLSFTEPGNIDWQMQAIDSFQENMMDAPSLLAKLKTRTAASGLRQVP